MAQSIDNGNYAKKVKQFLSAHEGRGFLIALADGQRSDVEYEQSLLQWGAWFAFFRRNKIKQPYMYKTEVYMVPTEWPHEFTTDSSAIQDHAAGELFAAKWRRLTSKKHPPKTMYEASI